MALAGYCIDTDILIDYLRGVEDARLLLLELGNGHALLISAVTVVELFSGQSTKRSTVQRSIATLLSGFITVELSRQLAEQAGLLRRDYQMPFADAIVAATALTNRLCLVSRNEKHFARVSKLKLKVPY